MQTDSRTAIHMGKVSATIEYRRSRCPGKKRRPYAVAVVVGLCLSLVPSNPGIARTWTMNDGQKAIDGHFVKLEGDVVSLQTLDGELRKVSLAELSDLDRDLASRLAESKALAIEVEARGVGLTPTEALQNAFKHAVTQAVGSRVKSKTAVADDVLVEDTVLVFSDGFVSRYETVEARQEAGLSHARIKATIQRRDVGGLATEKATARDASHLYAEAFTKVQRHRVAMAILQDALDGFNAELLDLSLFGRDKAEVIPDDAAHVRIRTEVRVRIRLDRYRTLADELTAALTAIARASGRITTQTRPLQAEDPPAARIVSQLGKQFLRSSNDTAIDYGTLYSLVNEKAAANALNEEAARKRESGSTLFFVCAPPSGSSSALSAKSCTWRWFEIDGYPTIPSQRIATVVRFSSADGKTVHEDKLAFEGRTPGLSASGRGRKLRTVVVSPFFLYHVSRDYFIPDIPHSREVTIRKTIRLALDDLARVHDESVLATGVVLERQADFPPDADAALDNRPLVRKGRVQPGQVQRFAVGDGVIETTVSAVGDTVTLAIKATGFSGNAQPVATWMTSSECRAIIETAVRAVARTGGSWKAEFSPFKNLPDDVIAVEMYVRRQ
jgi:hypothetical protein